MNFNDINMYTLPTRTTTHNLFTSLYNWMMIKTYKKMFTQMFADITGTGEEDEPPQIEKKASSKAGGKTRRGKRD